MFDCRGKIQVCGVLAAIFHGCPVMEKNGLLCWSCMLGRAIPPLPRRVCSAEIFGHVMFDCCMKVTPLAGEPFIFRQRTFGDRASHDSFKSAVE